MGLRWHGTGYQADNRWHKANMMRWDDGALPVGGWVNFLDSPGDPSQIPAKGAIGTRIAGLAMRVWLMMALLTFLR